MTTLEWCKLFVVVCIKIGRILLWQCMPTSPKSSYCLSWSDTNVSNSGLSLDWAPDGALILRWRLVFFNHRVHVVLVVVAVLWLIPCNGDGVLQSSIDSRGKWDGAGQTAKLGVAITKIHCCGKRWNRRERERERASCRRWIAQRAWRCWSSVVSPRLYNAIPVDQTF